MFNVLNLCFLKYVIFNNKNLSFLCCFNFSEYKVDVQLCIVDRVKFVKVDIYVYVYEYEQNFD